MGCTSRRNAHFGRYHPLFYILLSFHYLLTLYNSYDYHYPVFIFHLFFFVCLPHACYILCFFVVVLDLINLMISNKCNMIIRPASSVKLHCIITIYPPISLRGGHNEMDRRRREGRAGSRKTEGKGFEKSDRGHTQITFLTIQLPTLIHPT